MALTHQELLAKARELPIPVPWDRNKFIANLAEMRNRPIRLLPMDSVGIASPCGLWLVCENEDVILHEQATSGHHIDQIVGHEVGHMMLGHDRIDDPNSFEPAESSQLYRNGALSELRPDLVHAVLGRHNFHVDHEQEAEAFASLLTIARREREFEAEASVMQSVFFQRR